MASQSTVRIEQWFIEGWQLYKRHPVTFSLASFFGVLICLPPARLFFSIFSNPLLQSAVFLLLAAPLYGGLQYMALKSMRGEDPRIRDIFKGFRRYWPSLFLWWLLSLIVFIMLYITTVGVLILPLLWTIALLALSLLIDKRQSVDSAFSSAVTVVLTFTRQDWQGSLKNWGRFWLYGLLVALVSGVGILGFFCGLFITLPFAVCVQTIAYREIFKEMREPSQESSFTPQAEDIGPISQIGELCNQICQRIRSASDDVKPLLEDSIEAVDNVFAKADRLSQHLQEINTYLTIINIQTLNTEKIDITRKRAEAQNSAIYAQYEEALHALEEQIENHGRLEELRDQINAQLVSISVSLGNMQSKIIRIKTAEISNVRLESDNVSATLHNLQIETNALLETLVEVTQLDSP